MFIQPLFTYGSLHGYTACSMYKGPLRLGFEPLPPLLAGRVAVVSVRLADLLATAARVRIPIGEIIHSACTI